MVKYALKSEKNTTTNTKIKHPLFFAYKCCYLKRYTNKIKRKNKNGSSSPYFVCNMCSGYFSNFSHLKRHILQVELKKMIKCNYCGKYVKRIDEHRNYCLFHNSVKCRLSKKLNHSAQINNNNITKKVFDLNSVTGKIIELYKDNYDYNIINNKYIYFCDNLIGAGSYGEVLFGAKLDDNSPLAIKIQKDHLDKDTMENEMNVLSSFPKNLPFPNFYYREISDYGNLIVESLVGPTIQKLFEFCDFSFDIVTVCNIGIDLLNCFEIIHGLGYVHNDLKSDNVAILFQDINKEKNGISCTLIDFGKSKNFEVSHKKKKNNKDKKIGNGNIKYSSYNALIGGKIGPRDDLESLCYFLLKYINNSLPWSNLDASDKKYYKQLVIDAKKNFDINIYCGSKYLELVEIFKDIKSLESAEKPKYSKYKKLLEKIIEKNNNPKIDNTRFKWQKSFYEVMKEFKENNNYQILSESIKLLFNGLPEQIGFSFLEQYYYSLKI